MKVVCINNIEFIKDSYEKPRENKLPLTIGKIYEVATNLGDITLGKESFFFLIDLEKIYSVTHFVTIDEWREIQLNKII